MLSIHIIDHNSPARRCLLQIHFFLLATGPDGSEGGISSDCYGGMANRQPNRHGQYGGTKIVCSGSACSRVHVTIMLVLFHARI